MVLEIQDVLDIAAQAQSLWCLYFIVYEYHNLLNEIIVIVSWLLLFLWSMLFINFNKTGLRGSL